MKLKRFISLLLCVAMVVGMVCTAAYAEDTTTTVTSRTELMAALRADGDAEIVVTGDITDTATANITVGSGTKVLKAADGGPYTFSFTLNLTIDDADTNLTVQDLVISSGRATLSADGVLNLTGSTQMYSVTANAGKVNITDSALVSFRVTNTAGTIYLSGSASVGDGTSISGLYNNGGAAYLSGSASVTALSNRGETYVSGSASVESSRLGTSDILSVSGTPSFGSLTYYVASSGSYANTSPLILVSGSVAGASIPVTVGDASSTNDQTGGISYYYDGTSEILIAQGTDGYTLTEEDLAAFSITLLNSSGKSMTVGGYSLHLDEENNQIVYGPDDSGWTITMEGVDEDNAITATRDNCNYKYLDGTTTAATSALVELEVTVTDGDGTALTEGTDYEVSYQTTESNTSASSSGMDTVQLTVTSLSDGAVYLNTYYIQRNLASESGIVVEDVEMEFVSVYQNKSYSIYPGYELFMDALKVFDADGNELTGLIKFYYDEDGTTIIYAEDYLSANYDYTVDVNAGKVGSYTFTVTFQGIYYGTMTGTLTLMARDLSNAVVTVDDAYYDSTAQEPDVTVTYTTILDTTETLTEEKHYTVSYANNIDYGTATVTITAVEGSNYTGETTQTFTIAEPWDEEIPVENQLELRKALELGYTEITVGADFALSSPVEITYDVTLKSVGDENYTITSRGMSKTDSMFVVSDGASLTLEDITIDGNDQTGLLYVSSGGMATVGNGAILTAGYSRPNGAAHKLDETTDLTVSGTLQDSHGPLPIYNAGTLTIQDGAYLTHLTQNSSSSTINGAAALYNAGTLNWTGGTFDADMDGYYYAGLIGTGDTTASAGTLINNQKTFTLSGGTINGFLLERNEDGDPVLDESGEYTYSEDRTAVMYGAVLNSHDSEFNMTGGTITGFQGDGSTTSFNSYNYQSGGGVYNLGMFNMSGGEITDNIAVGAVVEEYTTNSSSSGAGGGVYNQGVFTMTGGTISNNSAHMGGGVYNAPSIDYADSKGGWRTENAGEFYMTGGIITGNTLISTEVSSSTATGNGLGDSGSIATVYSGSALYASGDSVTEISGDAVIEDDTMITYTDDGGNESTYQAGIAVGVGTVSEQEAGMNGSGTKSTGGTLTITGNPTINAGVLLINAGSISYSTDLNNFEELTAAIDAGEVDASDYTAYEYDLTSSSTTMSSESSYSSYLILDGTLKTKLNISTVTAYRVGISFNLGISMAGYSVSSSLAYYSYAWNSNGDTVAIYGEDATASAADGALLTLYANGEAVDEAEAAIYLTDEETWVICTHTQTVENEDGTTSETHTWGEGVETPATCTEDGCITYTCTICGATYEEVVPATGHSYTDAVTDPTCTEQGYTTHTCTVCGDVYVDTYVSATGHTYGAPTFTWSEDYSAATATFTCEKGDTEAEGYTQTVDCTVTSATDEDGATAYTAICTLNGETYTDTKTVSASGETAHTHTYEGTVEVTSEATCTQTGEIVVTVSCTECGDVLYTYTIEVPATNHTYGEGTETVAATRYTQGMTTYTCTECGATKTEYTNKVNATFLFDDVMNDSPYYFIPVYWAYDLGITDGTSATTFGPSQGCTRAQFVTFLYRLAQATGEDTSTQATSTAFTDVDSDDYFYEAVLWAAENGITSGTGDTTFTPNRTITRREAIAMLYRYECAANGEPTVDEDNPFDDVTTDDYAYSAILWAVEQGITSGTSENTFSPANTCTRAMMVTFLYNYAAIQD